MNRVSVWQEFNACQFLVSFCLLVFSVLYGLRRDLLISCSYWLVFIPLFVWKSLAIVGAIVGIITYCCVRPRNRERNSPIQCRALFLSLIETSLLLCFELLVCYNLEHQNLPDHRLSWIVCFLPLIFLSIISVFAYVWLLRHGRSWEIQALFVVNILQFIFFGLKLDETIINWHYGAVFIPLWVVMLISIIFCVGRIIWAITHDPRTNLHHTGASGQQNTARRCCQILTSSTVGHLFTLLFLLFFQILLVFYMEKMLHLSFIVVCLPLYVALMILIYMSFSSRVPANQWWFGLRQDACAWILQLCPLFETYANIQYHFSVSSPPSPPGSSENVDIRTTNSTIRNTDSSRRDRQRFNRSYFYKQKPARLSNPMKMEQGAESDLLTGTLNHSPNNLLKLHEPD